MIWLIAGLLVLLVLLALAHVFSRTRPETLIRAALAIGLALLFVLGGLLLVTGRFALAFSILFPALAGFLKRRALERAMGARQSWQARAAGGGAGQSSRIRTDWLDLMLDHDSGKLSGTIIRGVFAGRAFESLTPEDARTLHREMADDPESRELLEAALDRHFGDGWREGVDGGEASQGGPAAARSGLSREEAAMMLGIAPDASPREVRAAHRRLMKLLHPDHGGTAWLAARLNEARDCLLGKGRGL